MGTFQLLHVACITYRACPANNPHSHRARRSAIAPFFSKQKIHSIIPYISAKAHRLCDRLEREYKNQNKPLVLNHAFAAFSFDIITYYAFARSFEYMEMPGFHGPFTDAAKELANTLHIMGHFPWLLAMLQAIPNSLAAVMNSHMGEVFAFHGVGTTHTHTSSMLRTLCTQRSLD